MRRAIFPGTFDPIHCGHIDIARRAALLVDELIVAVYEKPSKTQLFQPEERIVMAKEALKDIASIRVVGYSELTVEFARKIGAKTIVRGLRVGSDFEYEFRMALANKRLHQEIETIALITDEDNTFISASMVKEIALLGGDVSSMVPANVLAALLRRFGRAS
jgi:pantetheine-phosphate adenylyltransferase